MPNTIGGRLSRTGKAPSPVTATTLDLRDVPPPERHPKIHNAFAELDSGEALELVNDHEPRPLFYEMQAEVESFDADGYEVEQRDVNEFVAYLPKK
jgi:uncharacterized protein (DUF2249 family)